MAEAAEPSTLTTAHTITPLLFLLTLSGYGLRLSYQNITRLRQYEEKSEKAAQWSNTAAQRLHKTRTTQTTCTIVLLLSAITSATIFLRPLTTESINTPTLISLAGLLNTVALFVSRQHMANFWNDKNQVQIPFVEKFNEAIKGSEKVVRVLGLLGFSWAWLVAVLWMGLKSVEWLNLVWGFVIWVVGMMMYS